MPNAVIQNDDFPPGLIDEIMSQLPLWSRIHLLLNLAALFAVNSLSRQDHILVEMVGTITTLNFHHYLKIGANFSNLVHLPFSSRLTSLNLSSTPIGEQPELLTFLSHPIFQHLETLDLSNTKLRSLESILIDTQHDFPNLRLLNLSGNYHLVVPINSNQGKFPQLKELDLGGVCNGSSILLHAFLPPPPPSTLTRVLSSFLSMIGWASPLPAPTTPHPHQSSSFRLEKLKLTGSGGSFPTQPFRSPFLSQLKELHLGFFVIDLPDIPSLLFNNENNNFTHLDLSSCRWTNPAFQALCNSPLLTNLTALAINGPDWDELSPSQLLFLNTLIQSPLFSPNLKHLSLKRFFALRTESSRLATALDAANIKLETFILGHSSPFDLDVLSTSSCFSNLQTLQVEEFIRNKSGSTSTNDDNGPFSRLANSSNISNLTHFTLPGDNPTSKQLAALLTSPMMSNDLVQLEFPYSYRYIVTDDLIETLLTARAVPDDETTPLKFSKLQSLSFRASRIGSRSLSSIVQNLPQLLRLELWDCPQIDDAAIAALIANEHDNLQYPYPALPNLVHLHLSYGSVTDQGCIALSKSQLLDQLEYLHLTGSDIDPKIGLRTIVQTRLFSQMKLLRFHVRGFEAYPHLDNCQSI